MKVETVFEVGDQVWLMYGNEPVTATVNVITIEIGKCDILDEVATSIKYELDMGVCAEQRVYKTMENKLYATKQQLRDALFA